MSNVTFKPARNRYHYQKSLFKRQGQQWNLSFEDWYQWWLAQGVDKNGQIPMATAETLVMRRIDPREPWQLGNLKVTTYGKTTSGIECYREGSRPQRWKYKDPDLHARHVPFLRARAQAVFRKESWLLTFEEFVELWGDQWQYRGRAGHALVMARRDPALPWSKANTFLIQRGENNLRTQRYVTQHGLRKKRKKKDD